MPSHSTQLASHVAAFRLAGAFSAVAVALCFLSLVPPVPAAIVTSGDVQPADPESWTSNTTVYIGKTATGTLAITEGSGISSHWAYIGYGSGTTGTVTVDGVGSTWTNSAGLYVGYDGSATLNITSGGKVSDRNGYIGSFSGSTGTVTVDGAGSTWTNSSDLSVGASSSGVLSITNGAIVKVCGITYVGRYTHGLGEIHFGGGTLETGSLRAEESDLTGAGTIILHGIIADRDLVFDSADDLSVQSLLNSQPGQNITVHLNIDGQGPLGAGYSGTGSLTIRNGVAVASTYSYLGYASGSTGTVTVDGAGSTWTNSSDVYVGYDGAGALSITHGGSVSNSSSYIGYYSGSMGTVAVDGTGSTWTNSSDLYVGRYGSGTLVITGGGAVSSSSTYVGSSSHDAGEVTVEGAGSIWTNSSSIYVGDSGKGTLRITDGGKVACGGTCIGGNRGSTGEVTVEGAGSTWNCTDVIVGFAGSGTLSIASGGTVSGSHCYIGNSAPGTGTVTVDGTGSTWTNTYLSVGCLGNGTVNVTNGGTVNDAECSIGGASTGTVTIDGAGSTWTNSTNLYVGWYGTGTLNVTNGGLVKVMDETYVNFHDRNLSVIHFDGGTLETGLLWAEESELTGTGTIILHGIIADTELVCDSDDDLTTQTFTYNSQPGQDITVHLNLDGQGPLGAGGESTGSLAIRNGVAAVSTGGYVGYESGAIGTVTVDGAGSTWTNSSSLYVGHYGTGTLNITNGGEVTSGSSSYFDYIGYYSGSVGTVTVEGAGSTWTSNSNLYIGYDGSGTLSIANGGLVRVAGVTSVDPDNGHLGVIHFDGGTLETGSLRAEESELTGTGTIILHGIVADRELVFDSPDDLTQTFTYNSQPSQNITVHLNLDGQGPLGAGYSGTGSLAIRNGVAAVSTYGYIGYKSGSTGTVTVDGTDSSWSNSSVLLVGYLGSGTFSISNGGEVSNSDGFIGFNSGSIGTVTVDGAGSIWTNSSNLYFGRHYGRGILSITHGGLVSVAGTLTIDFDGDGDSFIDMATGGMLALYGEADDSLAAFLGLVEGTDAIRYWDGETSAWARITLAAPGEDYAIRYLEEGSLAGYTLLTVGTVPEPGPLVLLAGLALAAVAALRGRGTSQ